jgi:hypothetical protein
MGLADPQVGLQALGFSVLLSTSLHNMLGEVLPHTYFCTYFIQRQETQVEKKLYRFESWRVQILLNFKYEGKLQ